MINPFLQPILRRLQEVPDMMFGSLNNGEAWREFTLAEFVDLSLRFAGLVHGFGVTGKVVLIVVPHQIEAFAAFFGTMLAGGIPSFMPHPNVKQDVSVFWRQHKEIFTHIKPDTILVQDVYLDDVITASGEASARIVPISCGWGAPKLAIKNLPSAEAVCLLQHSSGTTGLKKGVQLTYAAVCDQLAAYRTSLRLDLEAKPVIASWLPLYHDMGLMTSFLLPLWLGIPIASIDPFEWTARPSLFFDAIERYRATHAWVPNFALLHQVRSVRTKKTYDLASLSAMVVCSEPCKPEAFDAFQERFEHFGIKPTTLQTCYAMAEAVFAVTQTDVWSIPRRLEIDSFSMQELNMVKLAPSKERAVSLLSCGRPIAGCEVAILSGDCFVEEDLIGEICIKAPFVFSGYFKNLDATKAAFHNDWYKTGDIGFVDGGEVFVVGRIKDVIIVNGKNIFAHDVEAAVSRVDGVKPGRVAAFGHYVESVGTEQLVVLAEREDNLINEVALRAAINRAVSAEVGVVCGDVRVVMPGWLRKTTSGKMSRSDNKKKYSLDIAGSYGGV